MLTIAEEELFIIQLYSIIAELLARCVDTQHYEQQYGKSPQ